MIFSLLFCLFDCPPLSVWTVPDNYSPRTPMFTINQSNKLNIKKTHQALAVYLNGTKDASLGCLIRSSEEVCSCKIVSELPTARAKARCVAKNHVSAETQTQKDEEWLPLCIFLTY